MQFMNDKRAVKRLYESFFLKATLTRIMAACHHALFLFNCNFEVTKVVALLEISPFHSIGIFYFWFLLSLSIFLLSWLQNPFMPFQSFTHAFRSDRFLPYLAQFVAFVKFLSFSSGFISCLIFSTNFLSSSSRGFRLIKMCTFRKNFTFLTSFTWNTHFRITFVTFSGKILLKSSFSAYLNHYLLLHMVVFFTSSKDYIYCKSGSGVLHG